MNHPFLPVALSRALTGGTDPAVAGFFAGTLTSWQCWCGWLGGALVGARGENARSRNERSALRGHVATPVGCGRCEYAAGPGTPGACRLAATTETLAVAAARPGCYELVLLTIWAISTKSMVGATPYGPVTRSVSSGEKKPSAASVESQT